MKEKIKKVSLKDMCGVVPFLVMILPSFVYKLYLKITKKELWLIAETENMARDNGYVFFKYIRENHNEIKCYYAINFNCQDYKKIKHLGNIIKWSSFKHYFYYMSATKNISSHKEGNPNQTLFTILHLYLNLYNNRVFLQHGITKDDAKMFYYKNTKFKYFICGAKREYNYIKNKFGYPDENVVFTGFSRFDNLHHNVNVKNQILLIPTWRRWFELISDNEEFKKSDYFNKWNSFLNNKKLGKFLNDNNIDLIFYPHSQMKKFINSFDINNGHIKLINDEVDIQKLLIESSLMITDYSSVYMDFAYMKKPIIYYQFDYSKYRNSHFKEGYFSYEKDGFGPIVKNEDTLVLELIKYFNNKYSVDDKYLERMNNFFELNDDNNCNRIFDKLNGCDNYEK